MGNHDCWVGNYFQKELGFKVFKKPNDLKIDNYNLFIGHGDGLGPGDVKYKFLKIFFRSSILKKIFSLIHPDIGVAIGSFLSKKNKILSGQNIKLSLMRKKYYLNFVKIF